MPVSIICYIIYQFIFIKMNAEQVKKSLIVKNKKSVAILTLYNILQNIMRVIADHLKQKYR